MRIKVHMIGMRRRLTRRRIGIYKGLFVSMEFSRQFAGTAVSKFGCKSPFFN